MTTRRYRALYSVIGAAALWATSTTGQASEWNWLFTPYVWGVDTSADVYVNDKKLGSGELDFSDVVDNLDMGAQFHLEGTRGRAGFFFDLSYLDAGDSSSQSLPQPFRGSVETKADIKVMLGEAAGTFRLVGEPGRAGLDLIGGVRWISLDMELDLDLDPALDIGTQSLASIDASDTYTDGFIGARYIAPLGNNWVFVVRADIATGDSKKSVNAMTELAYRFGSADQFAAIVGYRYFDMELESSDKKADIEIDMTMAGPMLGFAFVF